MRVLGILAALLLLAAPVLALDIGVGVIHSTATDQAAPLVGLTHPAGELLAIGSWWTNDGANDLSFQLALPIVKFDYDLTVQLTGGTSMRWEKWEEWRPLLNYGAALSAPTCGFVLRAGWIHVAAGGGTEAEETFFAGVYR